VEHEDRPPSRGPEDRPTDRRGEPPQPAPRPPRPARSGAEDPEALEALRRALRRWSIPG